MAGRVASGGLAREDGRASEPPTVRVRLADILAAAEAERRLAEEEGIRLHPFVSPDGARRAPPDATAMAPALPHAPLGAPSGTSGVRAKVVPPEGEGEAFRGEDPEWPEPLPVASTSVSVPAPSPAPFSVEMPLAIPVCRGTSVDEPLLHSVPAPPRRLVRRLLAYTFFLAVMGGALWLLAAGLHRQGIIQIPDGPVKELLSTRPR